MRFFIRILATIAAPKAWPACRIERKPKTVIVETQTTSGRVTGPFENANREIDQKKYAAKQKSTSPSVSLSKKMCRLISAVVAGVVGSDLLVFFLDFLVLHFFKTSITYHVRTAIGIFTSSAITGFIAWNSSAFGWGSSSDCSDDSASPSSPVNDPKSR